jgi:hypothetical protein
MRRGQELVLQPTAQGGSLVNLAATSPRPIYCSRSILAVVLLLFGASAYASAPQSAQSNAAVRIDLKSGKWYLQMV